MMQPFLLMLELLSLGQRRETKSGPLHFFMEFGDSVRSNRPAAHRENQIIWLGDRSWRFSVAYA